MVHTSITGSLSTSGSLLIPRTTAAFAWVIDLFRYEKRGIFVPTVNCLFLILSIKISRTPELEHATYLINIV
jgi:hypothetical protein